jgi:hypothetical protein
MVLIPIGSMYAIYGNMDPINIPPMLAHIQYMDPMGISMLIIHRAISILIEYKSITSFIVG